MDVGELQSKNELLNQASWIPVTPAKPNLPGQRLIHEPNPATEGNTEFTSSFSSARTVEMVQMEDYNWESHNNVGQFEEPYFDVADKWKNVSFRELLMKAEVGAMTFLVPAPRKSDGAAEGPVLDAEKEQTEGNLEESSSATWHRENPGNQGSSIEASSSCNGKCEDLFY